MYTTEQYKRLSDNASPLEPDYIVERVKWYEDPIYIKMCDCPEIQGQWLHNIGDWFYAKENLGDGNDGAFVAKGEVVCSGDIANFSWESSCDFGGGIENFNDAIWLPRQDQLQEMVGLIGVPLDLLSKLCVFSFTDFKIAKKNNLIQRRFFNRYASQFTSMEQLWLAFVMKEKYNKTWDGEKWHS